MPGMRIGAAASPTTAPAQRAAPAHNPATCPQCQNGGHEQREIVAELAKTDRKVRAHEQAHVAAAGGYARGGPTFQYTTGPDGQRYAVAGEVQIDTAPVPNDPAATLQKAYTILAAATAPADPSGQDRAVAAAAAQLAAQAQAELIQKAYGSREGPGGSGSTFVLEA